MDFLATAFLAFSAASLVFSFMRFKNLMTRKREKAMTRKLTTFWMKLP